MNFVPLGDPYLYCTYLKQRVPRDKWFCNPYSDKENKECLHCNRSYEIITRNQKHFVETGYGIEVTDKNNKKLTILIK